MAPIADAPVRAAGQAADTDIRPAEVFPLGAHWDGRGTCFSVFSETATNVELCLFDEDGGNERRVRLPETTAFCWHGYVPGVGPGQRYGFRADGPWAPADGHRCNPHKLLLDPYARAISGSVSWGSAVLPYVLDHPDDRGEEDSAGAVPRSAVVDDTFDWEGERPLRRPLPDTVIYEVHVEGFTKRMVDVPEPIRGTYAGLAHPAATDYLKRLGVTAVELLPIHHFVHDGHLLERQPAELLGLQLDRFLRASRRVCERRRRRPAGRRIQVDGEGAARRGHRNHSGRRLQPDRRGQWFRGEPPVAGALKDIAWFRPDGTRTRTGASGSRRAPWCS